MAQVTVTINGVNVTGAPLEFLTSDPVDPTGRFWVRTDLIGQGATIPGAPTAVTAVAGNAQATVSFVAPANNGGATITSYQVISSPGGITTTGSTSPITVSGLTNGTAYTFMVVATNAIGSGPTSAASAAVTPTAVANTLFSDTFDNLTAWTVVNNGLDTGIADGTFHRSGTNTGSSNYTVITHPVTVIDTSVNHRRLSWTFDVANTTASADNGVTSSFYAGFGGTALASWLSIGYTTNSAAGGSPGIVVYLGYNGSFINLVPLANIQLNTTYRAQIEVLSSSLIFSVFLGASTTPINSATINRATTLTSLFAEIWGNTTTTTHIDNMLLESL